MSAERVIAWNEVLSSAGLDPHAVDDATKRVIHGAVMKYAKASGWKPPAEAAPQRVATGARSAVAGDGMVMPFGRDKGKRLSELDERSLLWWKAVYERDVADGAKASFLARNQAALDAVNERLADFRRGEP